MADRNANGQSQRLSTEIKVELISLATDTYSAITVARVKEVEDA